MFTGGFDPWPCVFPQQLKGSTRVLPGFHQGSTRFCEGCGVVRALKRSLFSRASEPAARKLGPRCDPRIGLRPFTGCFKKRSHRLLPRQFPRVPLRRALFLGGPTWTLQLPLTLKPGFHPKITIILGNNPFLRLQADVQRILAVPFLAWRAPHSRGSKG